jgi:hypothetical protein
MAQARKKPARRAAAKATLDGREFEIRAAGEDMRVLTAMAVAQDAHAGNEARVAAFAKIMELYFGDAQTAMEAQDAFAAEHGGACDIGAFMEWLGEQTGTSKN